MNRTPDIKQIEEILLDRYGIPIRTRNGTNAEGPYFDIIPEDLDEREGFIIRIQTGWRSLQASFIPGNFSARLLKTMGTADNEKKKLFETFAGILSQAGATLSMKVNDYPVNPCSITDISSEWKHMSLNLNLVPFEPELNDPEDFITIWGGRLFAMIVSLLPLQEIIIDDNEILIGMPDGALTHIEVNRYERSQLNRSACIAGRGCICEVCGFDFGEVYGDRGKGFIHVHHIVPVSQLKDNYIIDPVKDLVPVCPNCHAMLHTVNPPLSVEELKEIIAGTD